MLPTPRPKRRHCAPGTLHLSPLTTARKTAQPTGHAQRSTRQCAQNRTPALYTPRSTRLPLRARPHASRVRATLNPPPTAHKTAQPAGQAQRSARSPLRARPPSQPGTRNAQPACHCAKPHSRRAAATLSPPATARKTPQPVGYAPRSARPHCAQDRTASRVRAASARPHCAQNRTPAGRAQRSARPTARKTARQPGRHHAQPAAGDVKTSQSRLT